MKLIIAKNNLDYIGLDNKLPWSCKEDLKHFKEMTMNQKLLVGRVTYENMPKLKGREMIVVGSGYHTLDEALSLEPDWVIGGAKLMESVIHLCDEAHVSHINNDTVGDTKFNVDLDSLEKIKIFNYYFDEN
jgi:dihydrofolate reductase